MTNTHGDGGKSQECLGHRAGGRGERSVGTSASEGCIVGLVMGDV